MNPRQIDPRILELYALAADEGQPLALPADVICGLEDRGQAVDPFTGARTPLAPRWLTARGLAVAQQLALAALILLAGLAPLPVHAGDKACRRIAHGRICYKNGYYYSIHCDRGYRVDPPGAGQRCVLA